MLDAQELATSVKARTLEALVVGDSRKRRERKIEDLLCHRLCPIVLEMLGGENLRLRESE
jgi:hypothetical protein